MRKTELYCTMSFSAFVEPISQYNLYRNPNRNTSILRFLPFLSSEDSKSPRKPSGLGGLLVLLNLPKNQIQRVSVIFGSKTMTDLSISTAFCRPSFWLMRLSSCSMLIA